MLLIVSIRSDGSAENCSEPGRSSGAGRSGAAGGRLPQAGRGCLDRDRSGYGGCMLSVTILLPRPLSRHFSRLPRLYNGRPARGRSAFYQPLVLRPPCTSLALRRVFPRAIHRTGHCFSPRWLPSPPANGLPWSTGVPHDKWICQPLGKEL